MGIIDNLRYSRLAKSAVQQQANGFNTGNDSTLLNGNLYSSNLDMTAFFAGLDRSGIYDNYYADANRIITQASQYKLFYVDKDGAIDDGSIFARYLDKPNETYPQKKVLEQMYTELITRGQTQIFIWRKEGKAESTTFAEKKKYKLDDFRGWTLVSGVSRLTADDKKDIVTIKLGANQANVFMGYSPTQASNSWRKMQDEMGLHMTAFARNAGMPIGQWVITASSPEEYAKIRAKLEDKMAGARNNGKMLYSYLPSEAKQPQIHWQQFTSQDVQDYTKQLEFAEKKMSQAFGVPGTVKGTNDGENYATARVSEQVFIKYTIKPIVDSLVEQLSFALETRFDMDGEIKATVEIPAIADESLMKIRATEREVALFDAKLAEGYTPESIISAFDLPERFLLLERDEDVEEVVIDAEDAENGLKQPKTVHNHAGRDEFARNYQNSLTKRERESLETSFNNVLRDYAQKVLEAGISEEAIEDFEGKMVAVFGKQYKKLFNLNLDDIADELVEALDLEYIDIADLELTDTELEDAKADYERRVKDFSASYSEQINSIDGPTLEVRSRKAEPHIKMVTVTESEHARIVSELAGWTKAQEEFPVRITKKWNYLPGACEECVELGDMKIDVTALFIGNDTDEIYRVAGGGLHPSCRCYCTYETEAK